jgi:hypothetical protein
MWRGFFLAVGITSCILGAECLVVERAVLASPNPPAAPTAIGGFPSEQHAAGSRDFTPPEWAPWSLLSAGAVVILYSFTIPKRVAGG